ncbi:MAG: hypothetical protein J7K65_05415 [Planctomycetes bacterium]|nr:hypothetical protein [Planctomycetota bacterium]
MGNFLFRAITIKTIPKNQILSVFLLAVLLGGCGDFFDKTPTDLESKAILRDISRVKENPDVGNPLPSVYLEDPKRLKVEDGVKLFYFTQFTPVGDLTYVNKDKNLEKKVQGFGGTIRDLGFKVSTNPSTNQLIIHCADDQECDQVLAYLEKTDVPPIQVHIDCLIVERFGDITQDWEASLLIENFLGEQIALGAAKFPKPTFPGASLRESRRGGFGLDIGYWINKGVPGHQVRVLVDILESRGYLKVLMNPTLESVNGKPAQVQIRDYAPIEKIVTERGDVSYSVTDYQWVEDTLRVTPFVYADGSIGLQTHITIGSKSKPEGVVQTSIITERSIDIGENRIEPGKSLIIGGMRKSEKRSVVRGVPFFKDLPIIGILFSSKDFEEKATEIVFVLTPSISSGGIDYKEAADMVRKKFETPDYESDIDEIVTDPLGTVTYSEVVEKQAEQAGIEMVQLQVQAAEAVRHAQAEQLRAEKAILDIKAMRAQTQEAQAQIEKTQAQKKVAEAEKLAATKEAQAQQTQMTQTQVEIEKVQAEAGSARSQAQKAQADLKEAEQKVQSYMEQATKIRRQAEEIQQRIEIIERQAAEKQAAERQAAERQAAERQAAEKQAAEKQAAEKQAVEKQAAEKQTAAPPADGTQATPPPAEETPPPVQAPEAAKQAPPVEESQPQPAPESENQPS